MDSFDSKTVSKVVGASLRQIQYWDEQGFIRPSIKRATGKGSKRLYSFADLIKLRVAKNLADHGMTPGRIRVCLRHLNGLQMNRIRSSQALKYLTDGRKLFVLTDDRTKMLAALEHQFVFSLAIGDVVSDLSNEVRRLEHGRDLGRGPDTGLTGAGGED